jgi:hypothetical protein
MACYNTTNFKFDIKNDTLLKLEKVMIKASGGKQNKITDIDSKKRIKANLDMTDIPITDGSYIIQYTIKLLQLILVIILMATL